MEVPLFYSGVVVRVAQLWEAPMIPLSSVASSTRVKVQKKEEVSSCRLFCFHW